MKKIIIKAQDFTPEMIKNFWSKVDIGSDDQCWNWTGALCVGYGNFRCHQYRRSIGAHRVSYALANGETSYLDTICHVCDNPLCVNPRHLWAGTASDNFRDCEAKGRLNRPIGSRVGTAKLEVWDVIAIRNDPRKHKEIAMDFGISMSNVSCIKSRKYWTHVPEYSFA